MKNISMKKQLLQIFGLVTVIPIIVLSLFYLLANTNFIKQEATNQKYATQRLAETVRNYVGQHVNYLESVAFHLSQSQKGKPEEMNRFLQAGKEKFSGFVELYIGDAKGKIITAYPQNTGEFLAGKDFSKRDHYDEMKRTRQTIVTPILLGRDSGAPLIMISVPILLNGEFKGYVLGALDLTMLQTIILDYHYGTDAYPVVLDQENKTIYHPLDQVLEKNYDVKQLMKENQSSNTILGSGIYWSTSFYGREYMTYEKIPQLNWVVYVSKPLSAFWILYLNIIFFMLIVIVAALFLARILAHFFARKVTQPVEILMDYSQSLETKQMETSELKEISLPYAAKELNLLLSRFYEMGKSIIDHRNQLLVLNEHLEQRVDEKTASLMLKNRQWYMLHHMISHEIPIDNTDSFLTEQFEEIYELLKMKVKFFENQADIAQMEIICSEQNQVSWIVEVEMMGKSFGFLALYTVDGAASVSQTEKEFLQLFGRSLAMMLHNQMLFKDLQNRNQILRRATEHMNDGFVMLNQNFQFTYINTIFSDRFGLKREDLLFTDLKDLQLKVQIAEGGFAEVYNDTYETSVIAVLESTGNQVYFRMKKFPIEGQDDMYKYGLVLENITENVEIDRLKNELISITSHEYKTPITSLKGAVETLLRKDVCWEPDFVQDLLADMAEDVERLEQLTSDWLDIVKIDSGSLYLQNEEIKLEPFLQGIVNRYQKNIHIELLNDCLQPVLLNGDRKYLMHVISNLIDNAIRYNERSPEIQLTLKENVHEICIEVKDNGIGIHKEHFEKIFDKFYLVDLSNTRKRGGTGLGLAICKGIVEAHGGYITVSSQLNVGSTFILHFPKSVSFM